MPDYQNSPSVSITRAETGTAGFLHPERAVGHLGLRPGMVVADFGCGSGHFAIPIARMVGESGKVFAIDIQKQSIELIKSRANLEHLLRVEPVWADLEAPKGSHLPEDSVDMVLIANILFQTDKKREVLNEAHRILHSGGALAMLEWDESAFPTGPPPALRVAKRTARTLAEDVGFSIEKEFDAGSHHYGLLFKKQ